MYHSLHIYIYILHQIFHILNLFVDLGQMLAILKEASPNIFAPSERKPVRTLHCPNIFSIFTKRWLYPGKLMTDCCHGYDWVSLPSFLLSPLLFFFYLQHSKECQQQLNLPYPMQTQVHNYSGNCFKDNKKEM